MLNHRRNGGGNAQCVCQNHRGLEVAQLLNLGVPCQLAESVAHEYSCRDLLLEDVSVMRQNSCDPGSDRVAFLQCDLSHLHPGHIGNGVVTAGTQYADLYSVIPGSLHLGIRILTVQDRQQ